MQTSELMMNSKPLTLSMSVEKTIEIYFKDINDGVKQRDSFSEEQGSLDFLLMRRFLFTMFNNMCDLDVDFITPKMHEIAHDLKGMSRVYSQYRSKASFPDIAFGNVFLSQQKDYMQVKQRSESLNEELGTLEGQEKVIKGQIKAKNEKLANENRNTISYVQLVEEIKKQKGRYIDTIHDIATIKEQFATDSKIMHDFEDIHKGHFLKLFNVASTTYKEKIISILNAQAFKFDFILWEQAKSSNSIIRYFKEAQIQGEFCSTTYLKYYLNSLNTDTMSEVQQQMQELYNYLRSLEVCSIMVVVKDIDDAMNIKSIFSTIRIDISIEVFVDEAKAIHWAQSNRVSLILLDDRLNKLTAGQFLTAFEKRIGTHIRVAVISDDEHFQTSQKIEKVIKRGFRRHELVDAMNELIG
jgi:hypothetical protein